MFSFAVKFHSIFPPDLTHNCYPLFTLFRIIKDLYTFNRTRFISVHEMAVPRSLLIRVLSAVNFLWLSHSKILYFVINLWSLVFFDEWINIIKPLKRFPSRLFYTAAVPLNQNYLFSFLLFYVQYFLGIKLSWTHCL